MSRSNAKQLQKDVVEIAAAKGGDQAPPRRRGRPPKPVLGDGEAAPVLTREQILAKAIELARVQPLSEISMVGLARELGVPAGPLSITLMKLEMKRLIRRLPGNFYERQ